MTRLRTEWIRSMEQELQDYNAELIRKCGTGLCGIAAACCGMDEAEFQRRVENHRVGVVSITSGEGIIKDFTETVAAILRFCGADAFATRQSDEAGFQEAKLFGADILFYADDIKYLAHNLAEGRIADNDVTTGYGFAEALDRLSGGLAGKNVLAIGVGNIGGNAVKALLEKQAHVTVYDKKPERMDEICATYGTDRITDKAAIKSFEYILDATREGGWLTPDMLSKSARISTPGIPLSLTEEAVKSHGEQTVHDLLQIGTVVMLGRVI